MNAAAYTFLLVVFFLAWSALLWFRRRLRFAEILLTAATLGLLLWLSAGFDWGVFDEDAYPVPPPDQTWNIAAHTDLLNNQAGLKFRTFRGRTVRTEKRGATRLVALGSSSTFGSGLPARVPAYPALLEQILARSGGRSFEVINAGLTGHHSFQLMILLTEVLAHTRPDLVLFYYGKNEGTGNSVKRYYQHAAAIKQASSCRNPACLRWAIAHGTAHPWLLRIGTALERLGGYRWLRNRILSWRQRYPAGVEPAPQDMELPPNSDEILDRMATAAQEHGFRLVLVPELRREGGPVNGSYAARMEKHAAVAGVEFLDISGAFGVHPELFQDDIHPTGAGHQHLAEVLAAALAANEWL
ncbi:MAG: SGNH/GDSL hydrolase family protein [Candidatus Lernaella stagnicola]|nr:SGNH/GDSL hydrolase family protein [Candidatus Lernaella stagnicola]